MQELTYASKSFVTTDAITDALLELVTAIDRRDHSEAVAVPAFTEDGALIEVRMTLDASSEIVAMPVTLHIIDDDAAAQAITEGLEDLRARTTRNSDTIARPVIEQGPPTDLYLEDF